MFEVYRVKMLHLSAAVACLLLAGPESVACFTYDLRTDALVRLAGQASVITAQCCGDRYLY